MSSNGTIVHLSAGEYSATLASAGATLAALTRAGRDLVLSFDPARELGHGYVGRTLAPWPNRISDSHYSFDGVRYDVPSNEPATGAALHGLACWTNWAVESIGADAVTFVLELPGSPGYPFAVRLRAAYTLDADAGLAVVVSGTNLADVDAPLGLSAHPYLTCGVAADECTLTLAAERVLLVDARMRPVAEVAVAEAGFDFNAPTSLDGRRVDHAFTGLPQGEWAVTLAHPSRGVRLTSDAPWVQAFTGDVPELARGGVAIEPMTCPPDAFNSDPGVRLAPGETRSLRYAISAL